MVDVVEPWMAWLIQCSMLMLPWLEVGVPWESPCTEPSSSEPEEVSVFKKRFDFLNSATKMIIRLTAFLIHCQKIYSRSYNNCPMTFGLKHS